MKNLKKMSIGSLVGIALTTMSVAPSFGQNPMKNKYPKNGFEISVGRQTWNDENLREKYKGLLLVELNYSRNFIKSSEGEISLEFGSLKKIVTSHLNLDEIMTLTNVGNTLKSKHSDYVDVQKTVSLANMKNRNCYKPLKTVMTGWKSDEL